MTSIIKLHAISGALDESPPCYILQVDELRILLDCGWDEKFDQEMIKELKRHVHTIDAVLLSYPDPLHLGALPYLVGKCGLSCPIYATIPVYKMGQMFMYDVYQSRHNTEDFTLFTLDDVDAAFDKIVQLKYNQSISMKGKGYGVTLTPLPAGHMIGGTIWKIVKVGEEDIIYAVDFNHKKERHLNGCELERLQRPSLLITDSFNATYQQARRRARDEKLMTNILQTLRGGGNVLVGVDTAGRVLELAHMLDQLWRNKESGLLAYSLALLNNVSYNVVEFAKSQIEWMSDKLMKSFEGARNNPFQFKHLQLCHSMTELNQVPSPKVVLASTPDMECGFSRELFLQWCGNPQNSIIITSRSSPGTLARDLIENGGNRNLTIEIKKKVKLEGLELEEYQKKEKLRLEQQKQEKMEIDDMSSESEDEIDVGGKGKHDLLVKQEHKPGFFKQNKKLYPMFPFVEEKIKFDDYGEIIKPEDYKVADAPAEGEDNKENFESKTEDQFHHPENASDVPTKCVTTSRSIAVNASVTYIDFEGRSDGESLQKILIQLRPRRVILVRGSQKDSDKMAQKAQLAGARVFIPTKGETMDVTTETHIYQVRLTDALVSSLKFSRGKSDTELAWVDAAITARTKVRRDVVPDTENEDPVDESENILTLEPLPLSEIPGHETAFINELKLSDFKQILSKSNMNSEFSGGVLWCCNNTIAVRRHEAGKIIMEGCLSEEYYKVRELLYEQYAIV
ncbi:probable cleavage and polyadenylation specificity factor subunit 2 [Trichogramma pretiosum]|uniref:probable cleavage and polyadenylation specificity factor subunit 2 n=1 Tax=Trichogramma pretiosum TaxID=7493 RepID=UPI0006C9B1A5|nr:probable cleavage and polyadenylation specificity factor subunit 2 [Trichogramma pretiosum]XP_014237494.1 probable cleavage and polyadenylation specificity factor subunit 2 [Trichogramma pretiosum]XP_014237503.1 probable cleavage and polyadenylation specificity factor subunit 2 [Trichogramma pretiosum]XP_023316361.1 probable cleavage and polyadenylation specificity factor subunit 2 [Trichogramma pretiosum]